MLPYLHPHVYQRALMARPAGFIVQKQATFYTEPLQGCVEVTESGLVPMTLSVEVTMYSTF